jgi:hypothetical protein
MLGTGQVSSGVAGRVGGGQQLGGGLAGLDIARCRAARRGVLYQCPILDVPPKRGRRDASVAQRLASPADLPYANRSERRDNFVPASEFAPALTEQLAGASR